MSACDTRRPDAGNEILGMARGHSAARWGSGAVRAVGSNAQSCGPGDRAWGSLRCSVAMLSQTGLVVWWFGLQSGHGVSQPFAVILWCPESTQWTLFLLNRVHFCCLQLGPQLHIEEGEFLQHLLPGSDSPGPGPQC